MDFRSLLTRILTLLSVAMWVSCENSLTVIREVTAEDTLSAVRARNIEYLRSDSGHVYMRLVAPLMLRFAGDEEKVEFPEGFEAFFYDSTGQQSSRIKANYGLNLEREQWMVARGDVEVENFQTSELMQTSQLIWNQRYKTIRTGAPIVITGADKKLYGDSLTANDDLSQRTIYNIRGTLELEDDDE
ncbi:MAG: LPS export ABC transporter periplasmic protein LptC [Bacteroidetes bacterium]|nr:LPS export ABC transporter periplasmic protein LptC [Bacteroidota bacterium]